jgi:quercetin dioxygenase-like cupin family protein
MGKRLLWVTLGALLGAAAYVAAEQAAQRDPMTGQRVKVLLEQALAEKIDGQEAKVTLVEVEKAPGNVSAAHRHPGPVVGYVLEGELESQVEAQPLKTYRKGDVFYEPARALHAVSRNPSQTAPVRFLAFFVTAKDAKDLVIPEKP